MRSKRMALLATLLSVGIASTACGTDEPAGGGSGQHDPGGSSAGAGAHDAGDDASGTASADTSSAGTAPGGAYAAPGRRLGLGEEALIPMRLGASGDVSVTLSSIETGDPADIAEVDGADGRTPYYLHWRLTGGEGSQRLAYATPSRAEFRALVGDDRVAAFMSIVGTFEPCQMEPFPKDFGPGVTHEVCMVAVPPKGAAVTQGLWGKSGTDYDFITGKPLIWGS